MTEFPATPDRPPLAPGPLPARLAAALVFVSSGACLVLEVTGMRLVGPYLGVTLQTSSAVIGVALAAIAYGTWTGGWLADRLDARNLLAPVLLLAAAATAVVPPAARFAGAALRGTDPMRILLLTALTLFIPSALLAAVTPLVVKLQLGDLERTGRVVGSLSSVGTVGGITATLGTGFILIASLPTTWIVLGLAGLLALIGASLTWYLPIRRLPAVVVVLGLAGAGLTVVAPNPCDIETAYHCASVTVDPERPTGRILWLNSARHSYVDLSDPRYLRYEYVQWIGALADSIAPEGAPISALHLGGGGFTLPRYLAATRPGGENLVFELDGELVGLARRRLGLRTGSGLRVSSGDARANLAEQPAGLRDLVIGDAFGHLSIPWHLTTRELVTQVHRTLRPGGVYALNVIDHGRRAFVKAEIATIGAVFGNVAVVAPPASLTGGSGGGGNFVILASDGPLPLAGERGFAARVAGLPAPVTVLSGAALRNFVGGAATLTDGHAPVDRLMNGW